MEEGLILITFIVTEEDSKLESKRLTNILLSCTQRKEIYFNLLIHAPTSAEAQTAFFFLI